MYDFRTLSPLDFEELVRDLLQAEFGLLFESFGPGRDLGTDFRFAHGRGNAIVQAKHYPDATAADLLRIAGRENEKVAKLKPTRYLLATSAVVTPHSKTKLREALSAAPLGLADIFGREDLNNLLGRHKEIERKHFKLWLASTAVLERILHSGVYNRTETEIEIVKKMVPKFVYNESVARAEEILSKHGALIIIGEPGVGKTTLARMLLWLHAEQDWKIFVIDDIKEAFEMANEGEKRLIFFDDFLGQVRLSADLIRGMDQRFPPFLQRVRNNKDIRFMLTSRDYILHQAQAESSRLSSPTVNAIEFTLNVGTYSRGERARMLFNHLYFSDISTQEREALLSDDFFLRIIDHRNFNPRLIDLLTDADYISITGSPIRVIVQTVLENPQELWKVPYRSHMSHEARALMLALFFNEHNPGIAALERAFGRMSKVMGLPFGVVEIPIKFRSALREIEGSVLAIRDRHVTFANPGIRDFLQGVINEDSFLPFAVGAVTKFAEVNQAWTFFHAQKFPPRRFDSVRREWVSQPAQPKLPQDPTSAAWEGAASRLISDGSGTRLERLRLFISMFDYLESEGLLPIVAAAIRDLADSEIEGTEAQKCAEVIEAISSSLLPAEIQEQAQRVACSSAEKMLSEYSGLNLDEIESVVWALSEHSPNREAAAAATDIALKEFVRYLGDYLDSTESSEGLEEEEQRLRTLFRDYGFLDNLTDSKIQRSFQRRHEELDEKEYEDDENYSRSGRDSSLESQISDGEIKSMFGQLKV
jgi:hypothetical protein